MLRVFLLGDFCIYQDLIPIKEIISPRLQSLFSTLILNPGVPQNRSHIAFLFWPDSSEKQARTNLRNLLHQLKSILPESGPYIESNSQSLMWLPNSEYEVDVLEFKEAIAKAEEAASRFDFKEAQSAYQAAIEVYRGDLLHNCYDDWVIPYREDLRRIYISALEKLIRLLKDMQNYASAIQYANCLLQTDPLHELTYQLLMRLLALNNDRAGALRVYHACETVLQRDLSIKPSKSTQEAYEALLGEEVQAFLPTSPPAFFPVIGRDGEWSQMLKAWKNVTLNQGPKLLCLCGEAGIGKTRLLEEMIRWVKNQGIMNANAHCYAAEGQLAYAPITTWLRANSLPCLEDAWLTEIARLLPEVFSQRKDLLKPSPLKEEWQRERFFEALSRAILGLRQPLLLTIDDLQWCDRDTLEWIHFLLRFDRKAQLMILGAYRPEEVPLNHPLQLLLQVLAVEGGLIDINLSALDQKDTHTLASIISEEEISQEIAQELFYQSEGNPLFIVEMLRTGIPIGRFEENAAATYLKPDLKIKVQKLPARVHSILMARIAQLSPDALELAELAATIGREFNFPLLLKASGWQEDFIVNSLDELWRRRIIREQGSDAYDFSHDKLREVAYQNMSSGRRRLLHRRVAEALETIPISNAESINHQLALHFEEAGLFEKSTAYYLKAAEAASNIYANQEAINLIERGLALVKKFENPELHNRLIAQLWESLGDLLIRSAKHEQALKSFQKAQNLTSKLALIDLVRIQRKVAQAFREERRFVETMIACEKAESLLGNQPGEDVKTWWDEWIDVQIEKVWAHYWLAQWQELEALVGRINLVVKVRSSGVSRMRFLMASCLMNLRKYRYVVSDEMMANSRESLSISREQGSKQDQIDCLFELGFLHLWRRELNQAEENLLHSLALTENTGIIFFQTLCLTYLTVLYRFLGQMDKVLNCALQTGKVAEAAHMPDYLAASKANLAWLAWRNGDNSKTKQLSCQALEMWQQSPLIYPFQWMACFPRIGVAWFEQNYIDARKFISIILEPSQQILPEEMDTTLKSTLHALERGSPKESEVYLKRTIEIAKGMGYL